MFQVSRIEFGIVMINCRSLMILAGLMFMLVIAGPQRASAVPQCTDGVTFRAYNSKCDECETECTTRGSDLEGYICCCNTGAIPCGDICYPIVAESSNPDMTYKIMYGIRDNVLQKNNKGKKYIELYYKFSSIGIKIMLKRPSLAAEFAEILDKNRPSLSKLIKGEKVTISKSKLEEVSALLQKFLNEAGTNRELKSAITNANKDLKDKEFLKKLGIHMIN